jgi:hypothetical protein
VENERTAKRTQVVRYTPGSSGCIRGMNAIPTPGMNDEAFAELLAEFGIDC